MTPECLAKARRLATRLSKLLVTSELGFQGVDIAVASNFPRPDAPLSIRKNEPLEPVEHTITISFTTWRKKA